MTGEVTSCSSSVDRCERPIPGDMGSLGEPFLSRMKFIKQQVLINNYICLSKAFAGIL